jgi:hypothetical protein
MINMVRQLKERREALVVRSAGQRVRILVRLAPAARTLATADRFTATLRAHPVVAGLVAGGIALIGPRKLLRWAVRAVPIYTLFARS